MSGAASAKSAGARRRAIKSGSSKCRPRPDARGSLRHDHRRDAPDPGPLPASAPAREAPSNPADLEAAQASAWFAALRKAMAELRPGGAIAALAASGMRGRGSPGVPTGEKWESCAPAQADRQYVVVNAYQSDPAVMTDRVLLERTPTPYSRARRSPRSRSGRRRSSSPSGRRPPTPSGPSKTAIAVARQAGYLGDNVLGTRPRDSGFGSGRSRAPTCWARRRSCSRASRASAASPSSSRRTPRPAASSASPR